MIKIGFGAVGIKGGHPGNLEAINADAVRNRDLCIVMDQGKVYYYKMNQYLGGEENPPFIVKPVNITEDSPLSSKLKRWVLASQREITTNIKQISDKHIQTVDIRAISDENIEIEASNGNKVIINTDGVAYFPVRVNGVIPVNNAHLTTKEYVDMVITILDENIRDYLDDAEQDFENGDKVWIENYIDVKLNELETDFISWLEAELDQKWTDFIDAIIQPYLDSKINDFNENVEEVLIEYTDYNIEILEDMETPYYTSKIISSNKWIESYVTSKEIEHNLLTNNVIVGVYNKELNQIIPKSVNIVNNSKVDVTTDKSTMFFVVVADGEESSEYTDEYHVRYYDNDYQIYPKKDQDTSSFLLVQKEPEYTHIQPLSDTEWNINHGLGYLGVIVDTYNIEGIRIKPKEVELIDENNIRIIFDKFVAGECYISKGLGEPEFTYGSELIDFIDEIGIAYTDIKHNLDINRYIIEFWMDDEILYPAGVKMLDNSVIRVLMPLNILGEYLNKEIKMKAFYIGEET